MEVEGLQRLEIEAACRRLVLLAADHTDAARPEALAGLFTPDAVLVRPNAVPLRGPAAIRDAYAQRAPDRISRHLVTGTLFDAVSADTARARSLVIVWFGSTDDAAGSRGRPVHEQAIGEFDDRFVRTAEGWRIARREARFVLHAPVRG